MRDTQFGPTTTQTARDLNCRPLVDLHMTLRELGARAALTTAVAVLATAACSTSAHAAEHRGSTGSDNCLSWSYQDDWDWLSGTEVYLHDRCSRPCGAVVTFTDARKDFLPMAPRQSRTDYDDTTAGLTSVTGDSDLLDGPQYCPGGN